MGCKTPLFIRLLHSYGCFSGSTVLALSKYATIWNMQTPSFKFLTSTVTTNSSIQLYDELSLSLYFLLFPFSFGVNSFSLYYSLLPTLLLCLFHMETLVMKIWRVEMGFKYSTEQGGWSGNASDLHSGDAYSESRLGHRISWLGFRLSRHMSA
jgi:hypothetical protein